MAQLALLGGRPVSTASAWPRWPIWDNCEATALQEVLESGVWQSGSRVAAFEAAFAGYQGAERALCVTNGTASLEVALRALGVSPGDEVIVPSYTFAATALAVMLVGATPVFADSRSDTLNLDPAAVAAAIGPRTVGMIPVHIGGHPVDFDELLPLARRHGLFIVEDAAHAHGAEWRGRRAGALGDIGSFSFQTGKSLTSGDGGCLVANSRELAERCRAIRGFGRDNQGRHTQLGGNYRMTEFQATILHCQLRRLDAQVARRQANFARLRELLKDIPGISLVEDDPRVTRQPHYITLLHLEPEAFAGVSKPTLLEALDAEGLPLEPGYTPLQRQPVFLRALEEGKARQLPCPVAEAASDSNVLWISFRLMLAPVAQFAKVAEALEKIFDQRGELARSTQLGNANRKPA